jgi:hypothetical protein
MEKGFMHTNDLKLKTFKVRLGWLGAFVVVLFLVTAQSSFGQEPARKTFASPAEASNALFQAAQNENEQVLEEILGAGKEVTSSSDEVADKLEREQFTQKYKEMHRLVREPDGTTVLYIGAENWPFPVPLVSENGSWYFDSKTGTQEILFRRIGENETTAIEVCEEFALTKTEGDAKATTDIKAVSEDPITRFAQSLITTGTAHADSNAHATPENDSYLFHGYYFQPVTGNSAATGGKKGLALVAYPADYRSSGVKTFIVTQKGIVFEKDLGPSTTTVAPTITARSSGWRTAE